MDVGGSWDKDYVIKESAFPDPDKVDFQEIADKLQNTFRIGIRFLFSGGVQILYSSSDYICKNTPADCSLYNSKTGALLLTFCVNYGAIEVLSSTGDLIYSIPTVD